MKLSLSSDHVVSGLNTANWAIALLAVGRVLHVVGVTSLYSCLVGLPLLQTLFTTKSIAAACLVSIQKPFVGPPLPRRLQLNLARRCMADVGLSLLWMYSLSQCGPLRTLLIYGQMDAVPVALLSTMFSGRQSPARARGCLLYAMAVVALLLFDHDVTAAVSRSAATEVPPDAAAAVFQSLGVADHRGSVVLLLLCLLLRAVSSNWDRRLAVEVGGTKRLRSLVTLGSASLLLPAALVSCFWQRSAVDSVMGWLPTLVFLALVLHVVDLYVDTLSFSKLEASVTARVSSLVQTAAALLLAGAWPPPDRQAVLLDSQTVLSDPQTVLSDRQTVLSDPQTVLSDSQTVPSDAADQRHSLSLAAVAAALLFLSATLALTGPQRAGGRGQIVGYSATTGLPLYSLTETPAHAQQASGTGAAAAAVAGAVLRRARSHALGRRLLALLTVNVALACVQLSYGAWINSLCLLCSGCHLVFDCAGLLLVLSAAVVGQWKPTKHFPYGYGRVEVLLGFVSALLLLVAAYMALLEALHRLLLQPAAVADDDRLVAVAVLSLVVGGARPLLHTPAAGSGQLQLLVDALRLLVQLVAALLVSYCGWTAADALCSLLLAALMAISVAPRLRDTAAVLVLRAPPHTTQKLHQTLSKVLLLEGVESYSEPHFWSHAGDQWVGTLHVQVTEEADQQAILSQVTSLLRRLGFAQLAVQLETPTFARGGGGGGSAADRRRAVGCVQRAAMFDSEHLSSVKSI